MEPLLGVLKNKPLRKTVFIFLPGTSCNTSHSFEIDKGDFEFTLLEWIFCPGETRPSKYGRLILNENIDLDLGEEE